MRALRGYRVLAALAASLCFASCDMMDRINGQDPVKATVRNNPVDPGSPVATVISQALPDGTVVGTSRPTFSFEYSNGIASYTLQISASSDFTVSPLVEESGIAETKHRISTALADNGTYYWRVRPRFSDGVESVWCAAHNFSVNIPIPINLYPLQSTTIYTPFPTLHWNFPQGISKAELCISDTSDFTAGTATVAVSDISHKWTEPLVSGRTYYWRMRSLDSGMPSDWSESQSLMVDLPVPNADYPSSEMNLSDPYPTLKWFTPRVAESDIIGYQVQIDTSNTFLGAVTYDGGSPAPDYSGNDRKEFALPSRLQCEQQYYWRVRPRYSETLFGQWSESVAFFKNRVDRIIHDTVLGSEILIDKTGSLCVYGDSFIQYYSASGSRIWQNHMMNADECLISADRGIISICEWTPDIRLYDFLGNETWGFSTTDWWKRSKTALWADGSFCFIRTDNPGYALAAFDQYGKSIWTFPIENGYTDPIIGSDGTVYLHTNGKILAVRSDGTEKWKAPIPPSSGWTIFLSIGTQGRILISTWDFDSGKVYAISPADGAIIWTAILSDERPDEPIVGVDGTVFVNSYMFTAQKYRCTALDPNDGSKKWSATFDAYSLKPGILGNDGILYIPSGNEILALRTSDGSVVWQMRMEEYTDMPSMGLDGSIYCAIGDDYTTNRGIYVIPTTATGLADSPWPTSRHDSQRTGRASAP
jgi:hypothetical protein